MYFDRLAHSRPNNAGWRTQCTVACSVSTMDNVTIPTIREEKNETALLHQWKSENRTYKHRYNGENVSSSAIAVGIGVAWC